MSLKRGLLALGAALAAGVLTAIALGEEVIPSRVTATLTVSSEQAGMPRHPRGIEIDARGTIDRQGDRASLLPRSVDFWFPKGWVYNGAKHPACTATKLRHGGPAACPRGSLMGSGPAGEAYPLSPSTPPRMTVINGGRTKMFFWVVVQNPARVQAVVTGTITKPSTPRWSYRMHAEIPDVLRIVAGIPIVVETFHTRVGHGDWIATTNCPHDHRWRYHLRLTYFSGQALDTGGSVACRAA